MSTAVAEKQWEWTEQRERACELLSLGVPKVHIASTVGVHRNTISAWCNVPEFIQRAAQLCRQRDDEKRLQRQRAAARLRRGWTRGTVARDSLGRPVSCRSTDAVSWCLAGAVDLETDRLKYYDVATTMDMIRAELRPLGYTSLAEFNDAETRTRDQVVGLLTRAARRAREES